MQYVSHAALTLFALVMHTGFKHIHSKFPWLMDERSFTAWAPRFQDFADTFDEMGLPVPNLIGFIDGKLWPVCKPGRYQHVLYSGHKRIHGLKTQGIVFPNGTYRLYMITCACILTHAFSQVLLLLLCFALLRCFGMLTVLSMQVFSHVPLGRYPEHGTIRLCSTARALSTF